MHVFLSQLDSACLIATEGTIFVYPPLEIVEIVKGGHLP